MCLCWRRYCTAYGDPISRQDTMRKLAVGASTTELKEQTRRITQRFRSLRLHWALATFQDIGSCVAPCGPVRMRVCPVNNFFRMRPSTFCGFGRPHPAHSTERVQCHVTCRAECSITHHRARPWAWTCTTSCTRYAEADRGPTQHAFMRDAPRLLGLPWTKLPV